MNRRALLIVAAAAAIVVTVVLAVKARDDGGAQREAVDTTGAGSDRTGAGAGSNSAAGDSAGAPSRVSADAGAARPVATDPAVVPNPDGRQTHDIRDHRSSAEPADPDVPIRRPPSLTRMKSKTTAQVGMRVRPAVRDCAADYPDEKGEGAHVDVRLQVSVASSTLTIEEIVVAAVGIPDDGQIVDCIRDELDGMQLDVADAEDVARHPLNFPYDL